jgi:hypothetical protein
MYPAEKALLFVLDHIRRHGNVQDSEKAAEHHRTLTAASAKDNGLGAFPSETPGIAININALDATSFGENSSTIVDAVNKELALGAKLNAA